MIIKEFFEEQREQSRIKTEIVTKYFWAWSKVIIPHAKKTDNKIAYIDLFAGPGLYDDGTKSTPILLLEQALKHPDMSEMLISVFNDKEVEHAEKLKRVIDTIPNIKRLRHAPEICNFEVDEKTAEAFEKTRLIPVLLFADPNGYKGLSLKLISSVLKDWGCDCIFFFNYNRINMDITNKKVEEHINALYGRIIADQLREVVQNLSGLDREFVIVNKLIKTLQQNCGKYVLPFYFRFTDRRRTSHLLVFVSKHYLGYKIMKDIMAPYSTRDDQGVPSFIYDPSETYSNRMFDGVFPLDELQIDLLASFKGQELTFTELFEQHNVGTNYMKKNYQEALLNIEIQNKVKITRPSSRSRPNTIADNSIIAFP